MHNKRGFSLVEMLAAITIIAAISTLAVPQFIRATEPSVEGLADDLIRGLNASAHHAVMTGTTVDVIFDLAERKVTFHPQQTIRKLPDEFLVEVTTPTTQQLGEEISRIQFHSDALSSGGVIVLQSADKRAEVLVHWLNGEARRVE